MTKIMYKYNETNIVTCELQKYGTVYLDKANLKILRFFLL